MSTTDIGNLEMDRKEAARIASKLLRTIYNDNIDDVANISYAEACIIDNTNPNQSKVLISYLEQVEEFVVRLKTTLIRKSNE